MGQLVDFWWMIAPVAGFLAGAINVVVGAGTLVSFPLLVAAGCPPLVAAMANTVGIVPGSASGVAVYRAELTRRRAVVRALLPASLAGGILGANLLLAFPAAVFLRVVPWLVALGTVLVVLGPTIRAFVARRRHPAEGAAAAGGPTDVGPAFATTRLRVVATVGAFVLGVYGGYFSAAQGILLIGLLGIVSELDMQQLNALKNLTVLGVNVIAAAVYLVVAPHLIDWPVAGLVAVGATAGGIVGGRLARRVSTRALRLFVVVVGIATTIALLAR